MTPVRLEPAAPRSRVEHSTTEPLRSLQIYEPAHKIFNLMAGLQIRGRIGILYFIISHPKHMLCVLKRTISMRRFL